MNEIDFLNKIFASTYVLYNKTQQLHWNLKNINFLVFHKFFEEQYTDYQNALDEMAEVIVMGTGKISGDLNSIISESIIDNKVDNFSNIQDILRSLIVDHKKLIDILEKGCKNSEDLIIQDLYVSRIKTHKKNVWMMEASL